MHTLYRTASKKAWTNAPNCWRAILGCSAKIDSQRLSQKNKHKKGTAVKSFSSELINRLQEVPLLIPTKRTQNKGSQQIFDRLRWRVDIVNNSRRQALNRLLFRRSFVLNSLYLLITFFVLHKSSLTSDLLHSLFQLNGFKFFHAWIAHCSEYGQGQEQNQKIRKPIKTVH